MTLIRIVRMTFEPQNVEEFRKLFDSSKKLIRAFPGCVHLELLEDYHEKNVFSTYSRWDNLKALDAYRKSELFEGVWAKTKALFSKKPHAFSSKVVDIIEG